VIFLYFLRRQNVFLFLSISEIFSVTRVRCTMPTTPSTSTTTHPHTPSQLASSAHYPWVLLIVDFSLINCSAPKSPSSTVQCQCLRTHINTHTCKYKHVCTVSLYARYVKIGLQRDKGAGKQETRRSKSSRTLSLSLIFTHRHTQTQRKREGPVFDW